MMKKPLAIFLLLDAIAVAGILAFIFWPDITGESGPLNVSDIQTYVERTIDADLSDFKMEETARDSLMLVLSKESTTIAVMCRVEEIAESSFAILSLLYLPQQSRNVRVRERRSTGSYWKGHPLMEASEFDFDSACIQSQSCDEEMIIQCAMDYLSGELVGTHLLPDNKPFRWTSQSDFHDFFETMRPAFRYETIRVIRLSRSGETCTDNCVTVFDVFARDDGEILGSEEVMAIMVERQD